MTAKATIANLLDLGFEAKQFNDPNDWLNDPDGYLGRILQRQSTLVRNLVGTTTYDAIATGTVEFDLLALAEESFVEAELWRRLEKSERALVGINGGNQQGTETISSRKQHNADIATERAYGYLGRVTGVDYSSGLCVGYTETGQLVDSTI